MKTGICLTFALLIAGQSAHAEVIRFRVDGTLTAVADPAGISPLAANVGDTFSLVYSFESTTAGHGGGTTPPEILRYDAITAVTLFIGGNSFAMPRIATGEISIQNDSCQPFSGCEDGYHVIASNSIVDPLFFQFQMSLTRDTPTAGTAITSLLLPLSPPDLAAFDPAGVRFLFNDAFGGESAYLNGSISAISAVPVPGALWLLGSVLLGGGAFRRRTAAATSSSRS